MQRWLLVFTLAGALAVFGGWYSWSTLPLFFAALLVAFSDRYRTFQFPLEFGPLDRALILLGFAIGLQLIPLPPGVVSVLSPHAARVRGTLRLDAAFAGDAWIPLSVEPRATLEALFVYTATVLIFWSARAACGLTIETSPIGSGSS